MFATQWLEIPAAICSLINIYLAARANIWNWLFGIFTVSLYLIIFFEVKLYADMSLQLIFLLMQFYGWYQWLYGGKHRSVLNIKFTPLAAWKGLALAGLLGGISLSWILKTYTDSTQIALDVTAATLSLIAQWQMSKKYLENWLIWILVDIISIYMYLTKQLYFTAGLYFILMSICLSGYRSWKALAA